MVNHTSDEGFPSRLSRATAREAAIGNRGLSLRQNQRVRAHSSLALFYPERFRRGALFCTRAKLILFLFNGFRTLCNNTRGVPSGIPNWERQRSLSMLLPGLSLKTYNLLLRTIAAPSPLRSQSFPTPDTSPAAAPALSPSRPSAR